MVLGGCQVFGSSKGLQIRVLGGVGKLRAQGLLGLGDVFFVLQRCL